MRGNAALGIRAGEDPAIYGGVVQAASHDPGEGEARATIREKQVQGLPPPNGTGWTKNDGTWRMRIERCPRNPCG